MVAVSSFRGLEGFQTHTGAYRAVRLCLTSKHIHPSSSVHWTLGPERNMFLSKYLSGLENHNKMAGLSKSAVHLGSHGITKGFHRSSMKHSVHAMLRNAEMRDQELTVVVPYHVNAS